jgi:hypothetical protein
MANLSIKDFPDELLREGRIEALAAGTTFRELVIEAIGRTVGDRQREGAKPSLKVQRRLLGKRSTKDKGERRTSSRVNALAPRLPAKAPARATRTKEKIESCPHGLLFHPGCAD